jgi:hypothetical protein
MVGGLTCSTRNRGVEGEKDREGREGREGRERGKGGDQGEECPQSLKGKMNYDGRIC